MNLTVANPLHSRNPWLHKAIADIANDTEHSTFRVQDSETSPDGYYPVCQMCSIMSAYWVRDEIGDNSSFGSVSASRQQAIVRIAADNTTNEAQFNWAQTYTGYNTINAAAARNLGVGAKLLLYGPRHVTALVVVQAMQGDLNARVYDPETATVEYWNLGVWINMSAATGFLSS